MGSETSGHSRKPPKKARSKRPPSSRTSAGSTEKKAASGAARRPKSASSRPARSGTTSQTAARGRSSRSRVRREPLPPPVPLAFQIAIFVALFGGIGMLFYGCFLILRAAGSGALPVWATAMIVFGMLAGVAATVMVGLLAWYSFDPQSRSLGRLNKTYLAYAIVGAGMLAVVTGFTNPNLLVIVAPGLVPAVAVLFLTVRPRFRAIATARGRPAALSFHEKRAKVFEDAQRERKAQMEAREKYEKLKQQRLRASSTSRGTSAKKTSGH